MSDVNEASVNLDAIPEPEWTADRVVYELDCVEMTSREAAYDVISRVLPMPLWFGRNLDALEDSLWEIPPCEVVLHNVDALTQLGDYGDDLLQVFLDVSERRKALKVRVSSEA